MNHPSQPSRLATLGLWLLWAWVVMTVVHELGHVLTGVIGGGQLILLELRPWHLPHHLMVGESHPLLTLWGGPVLGCLIPLAVAAIVRRPACWFVAWFCVVANASYLLLGYYSGDGELDSTKMIAAGTRPIALLAWVAITLPLGYLRFRQACIDLMSGRTVAMSRRGWWISAAALLLALVVQSIAGQIAAALL